MPPTYPIGPATTWIIRAITAGWTAYRAYTDLLTNDVEHADVEDLPHWHRLVLNFARAAPTGFAEDRAVFKLDMLKTDVAGPADPWVVGDFTAAETAVDAWYATVRAYVPTAVTLVEYRWYRMSFNSLLAEFPFAKSGPPVRFLARSSVGTSSGGSPYQLAATVTLRTPVPKHWGRFYIPFAAGALNSSDGRIGSTIRDAIGGATLTMKNALHTSNIALAVPMTQLDKAPARALMGVNRIVVDDTPDVQRRRRAKHVAGRYIST